VIDHIGFSVPDVEATVKALQAAGAKLVTPVHDIPGLFKSGSVEDPFGVKMEIVQDPETPGFHHIHIRVPDPDASLKWYVDTFGGVRTKLKGQVDGIKYSNPNVWLLAQKADGLAPSQGHAIDHLGWGVTNVGAKVAELAAKGLKTENPRPARHLTVGFVVSPDGVRIEMVQGRKDEEFVGR
jgi:catechol 2,3-dioxygenase-like lactoylglutathione lyase family enzyme